MPFGPSNTHANFERLMKNILRGLKWQMGIYYLDDVVISSKDFHAHLLCLTNVFKTRRLTTQGHAVRRMVFYLIPQTLCHCQVSSAIDSKLLAELFWLIFRISLIRRNFTTIMIPLLRLLFDSQGILRWPSARDDAFGKLLHFLTSPMTFRRIDLDAPFKSRPTLVESALTLFLLNANLTSTSTSFFMSVEILLGL